MVTLKDQSGFTLIEVMVAMVILAIGTASLQIMQITSIRGNAHANRITTSSIWATDQLEQLQIAPYRDTSLTCATDPLCDTDNDGTNQDPDMDGLDTVGADTNFGLSDDTQATADHVFVSPDLVHNIFVNIATDLPIPNNKTVHVIVLSNQFGQPRRVEYSYIKTDVI